MIPERVERKSFPAQKERLNFNHPWVFFSMEIALNGLCRHGGLGYLAGDEVRLAKKLDLPFVAITLYYPSDWKQTLTSNFWQNEEYFFTPHPSETGFRYLDTSIFKANNDQIPIEIYQRKNDFLITLYQLGIGSLYEGAPNSDHRLYQEAVLGFIGSQALRKLGYSPKVIHLNESATTFGALAELDWLCQESDLETALANLKEKTLFTNHTLVKAASACYSADQFERYVIPNLQSETVKNWLREKINRHGGVLDLTTFALSLSGRVNGVSVLHSQKAKDEFGETLPITNGISLEHWLYPPLLRVFNFLKIINENEEPAIDYQEKIANIPPKIKEIKARAKQSLIHYLTSRNDQRGKPTFLPPKAKIAVWARRFAEYKRPGLLFSNPLQLLSILAEKNIHLVLAGKAHPQDQEMKKELQRILNLIEQTPILKDYVHFIQNYDENLGQHLTQGADIWINTPQVRKEACGTSWEKAIVNLTILISTKDGGVADIDPPLYLLIEGNNPQEEANSLYANLRKAADILENQNEWSNFVKNQLAAYLPIISGGRMMREYLNFAL